MLRQLATMSQLNNPILPALRDYSVLSIEELQAEIDLCKNILSIHHTDISRHLGTGAVDSLFRNAALNRLERAERELEYRFINSILS